LDEVIQRFNQGGVRYLLVGGQAMRLHGMPRFSMDWDFLIPPEDTENIARINGILENELDMPLEPLGPRGENFVQTYQTQWGIIQFHLGGAGFPLFAEAEKNKVMLATERGTKAACASTTHLLSSKRAANRPQDQLDIAFLVEKEKSRTQ
jgi:hypothetical protein